MALITKVEVAEGIQYVSVPGADVHILCGCPADSVKHLMKRGLIKATEQDGVRFETGPNAILLSDVPIKNGRFTNLCEFPILHMFYLQGRILPGHPNNTGDKPRIVGSRRQLEAQMEYAFRGNYGLVSEAEMTAAGAAPELARELMRLKLKFAFGKIRRMEEYLELVTLDDAPREIRNRVFVRRLRTNVFEISHAGESVRVDLNLPAGAACPPSYVLGYHEIRRDYFSVLHSGEGDGWDANRPAMASILMFQGKAYLIDAGANILHSLAALGLSVNEIAGVFHTHAHDDHFCGLPDLMRADHKLRYYATPLVRASVFKKLAALCMMHEDEFSHYFEFHDLVQDQWNDIDTLEVKPVFSPHPVETTVLFFRTLDRSGHRTYAHFADIASLKLLRGMITGDPQAPGISQELYDSVAANYLEPVDLKKLDIGGGLIHGDAEDFSLDASGKIVLAHTSLPLTSRQKEIGSGAPFGTLDVLIPSHQDYVRSCAYHTLSGYFPSVSGSRLRVLLNNPIERFNPESIIFKAGRAPENVFLLLTGQVEMIQTRRRIHGTLSAGAMLGDISALTGKRLTETFRAANFVQALRIPAELFRLFVRNNGLEGRMLRQLAVRAFLHESRLFGEALSCSRQNAIADAVEERLAPAGERIIPPSEPCLCLVKSGRVELRLGGRIVERIGRGGFFWESSVLFGLPSLYHATAATDATLLQVPASVIDDVPAVRWKLLEEYEARLDRAVAQGRLAMPLEWLDEYSTGVPALDDDHRELFAAARELYKAVFSSPHCLPDEQGLKALLERMARHFQQEEALMLRQGYPRAAQHTAEHRHINASMRNLLEHGLRRRRLARKGVGLFVKDWVMAHILTQDRKLGAFLRSQTPRRTH